MQRILPLRHKIDEYIIEDFIVTSSNKNAYDYINSSREIWGVLPFPSTALLRGPKASGKSFLAKIWQSKTGAIAITPENELTEFQAPAYLIEDIEKWHQEKLLAFFNMINEIKKPLLLTVGSGARAFSLKDLDSRINSLRVIPINKPDQQLLEIFILRYFSQRRVSITPRVIKFLSTRLESNMYQALKMLQKINNFAIERQRPISIELSKEILQFSL